MQGISKLSNATDIPGIRPNAKVTAAVNTVSRNSGNPKKLLKKTLRKIFIKDARIHITISLMILADLLCAIYKVYHRNLF
jgi:hypothetical protein